MTMISKTRATITLALVLACTLLASAASAQEVISFDAAVTGGTAPVSV